MTSDEGREVTDRATVRRFTRSGSRTVPFSRHSLAPSGSTSRGSFMTGGHESNEGTTDMTREPAR